MINKIHLLFVLILNYGYSDGNLFAHWKHFSRLSDSNGFSTS